MRLYAGAGVDYRKNVGIRLFFVPSANKKRILPQKNFTKRFDRRIIESREKKIPQKDGGKKTDGNITTNGAKER